MGITSPSLFRPFVEQMMRTAATATTAMMNMRYDIPSPMHMCGKEEKEKEIGLGRMWLSSVGQVSSRGRSLFPSRLFGPTHRELTFPLHMERNAGISTRQRHPHVVRAQDRGHVRAGRTRRVIQNDLCIWAIDRLNVAISPVARGEK